jgi:D-glycero-alpha-D-manno-heptose-7-phosphate kinase
MIIGRSPLRITLGGGGTDLPSYYRLFGGFLISAAIEQYVYTTIHKTYTDDIFLRYSKIERVKNVDDIQHPIIREALKLTGLTKAGIEITSLADQPAGTGLGSSGSFTTALLRSLYKFKKQRLSPQELAEMACHIELDLLKEPIGKQDQYIAAYGGLTVFDFNKDDTVTARPLNISDDILGDLEDNLVMVSTGFHRSASKVLKEQDDKSKSMDAEMLDNLHYVKDLGYRSLNALESGNLTKFGELMHEHWVHKKKRSASMSNPDIDKWYELGLNNGAIGGKLIGAGGGGFLLFYVERDVPKLKRALKSAGLQEVPICFDFEGTKIL